LCLKIKNKLIILWKLFLIFWIKKVYSLLKGKHFINIYIYMFQFILFAIILLIVYFISRNYPPSTVEGFEMPGLSLHKELIGTPLQEDVRGTSAITENTLIFPPGFQGSDRRQMPIADSPEKYGTLWTAGQELRPPHEPPFKPGKKRSVTFAENTSQIAGPLHKPPCPLTGLGPSDSYVGQSNDSNQLPGRRHLVLHDLDKVWTGHERDERIDLISAAMQSLCECDDPG